MIGGEVFSTGGHRLVSYEGANEASFSLVIGVKLPHYYLQHPKCCLSVVSVYLDFI